MQDWPASTFQIKLSMTTTTFKKTNADAMRETAYSNIHPGDLTLMKQLKTNKFSTKLNQIPQVVTACHSPSVTLKTEEAQYERNILHVRPLFEMAGTPSHTAASQVSIAASPDQWIQPQTPRRSSKIHHALMYLHDNVQ
jgi:hypothetical protein